MRQTLLIGAIVLVALAGLPLLLADVFYQRVAALVLLSAISASAWNLVGGYAGQVSVGHAMFFGVGAYAAAIVQMRYGLSPWVGLPASALAGALVGGAVLS